MIQIYSKVIFYLYSKPERVSYYHANNILVHTMGDEIKEGELPKQIKYKGVRVRPWENLQ
jgi:hypothetical protein